MLPASRTRILESLASEALVLDVGGWADPLERADWVIDMMPFETRGFYERQGWVDRPADEPERFSERTWVVRDLCDRRPWPFEDQQFDFVVCSQTLEDVRDPVWVCSELVRVGKAGYIEVPSRLEEQSFGIYGDFVGWPHHHWLIDVDGQRIEFVFKDHEIHSRPDCYFPRSFWDGLSPEERVETLWWDGSFDYSERVFLEERPKDSYLPGLVARELARRRGAGESGRGRLRGRLRGRDG
jgi:Methyltransferase domain